MLAAFIFVAELLSAELDSRSTTSVSGILLLASGILYGVPGVVIAVLAFAVAGWIDSRSPLHRVVFNVGNGLMATASAAWLTWALIEPFVEAPDFVTLLVPGVLAG